jgi:hypothetical protein
MQLLDKSRGPLPGSVANNRKFAIKYMRNHGFEVKADGLSEYPDKYNYYLRGEFVAWSYENIMYLRPVLPSLVEMGILAQRAKTEISFDLPAIELHKQLKDAVNELKSSSESYEDLLKSYRVQKVKRYFRYRFIAKQLAKALHEESRSSV